MLEGLGSDVAVLVSDVEPGSEYRNRFRCVLLQRTIAERIARRLHFKLPDAPNHRGLLRTIRAADVSAILVQFLNMGVMLRHCWRQTDKPVWIHCHGYDATWNLRTCDVAQQPVFDEQYVENVRKLPQNVRFIANSLETKQRLLNIGIDEERIRVKYMGVESPNEPPANLSSGEAVRFLFLGRLVDCKGPDLVIQAFEEACDRGMNGTLTIAGDGPLSVTCQLMKIRSRYADRISIVGEVDRETGERLRRESDVFCAHNCVGPISRQVEAFGVAFVEAMAAGLPVVSTRSGGLSEVLEDGKQGILVEPGDVKAQAEAFLRLAGDPSLRRQMGRSGWERVRRMFSIERELATLRNILELA